jgi:hypothetical protein
MLLYCAWLLRIEDIVRMEHEIGHCAVDTRSCSAAGVMAARTPAFFVAPTSPTRPPPRPPPSTHDRQARCARLSPQTPRIPSVTVQRLVWPNRPARVRAPRSGRLLTRAAWPVGRWCSCAYCRQARHFECAAVLRCILVHLVTPRAAVGDQAGEHMSTSQRRCVWPRRRGPSRSGSRYAGWRTCRRLGGDGSKAARADRLIKRAARPRRSAHMSRD